jgi:hypothetical protein
MAVCLPLHAVPGQTLEVFAPDGTSLNMTVPAGLKPGQQFTASVPIPMAVPILPLALPCPPTSISGIPQVKILPPSPSLAFREEQGQGPTGRSNPIAAGVVVVSAQPQPMPVGALSGGGGAGLLSSIPVATPLPGGGAYAAGSV